MGWFEPKEVEDVKHFIVTSDIKAEEDIGIITVRDDNISRRHHWVTFPDGTVRKVYSSRKIDATEIELLKAFDALPTLKVSYRPISKFLYNNAEWSALIMISLLLASIVFGVVIAIAHQFDGIVSAILNNQYGSGIATVLGYGAPLSILYVLICNFGEQRWSNLTSDDLTNNKRVEEYKEEQRQEKDREATGMLLHGRIV